MEAKTAIAICQAAFGSGSLPSKNVNSTRGNAATAKTIPFPTFHRRNACFCNVF